MTEGSLTALKASYHELEIIDMWHTGDVCPGRER